MRFGNGYVISSHTLEPQNDIFEAWNLVNTGSGNDLSSLQHQAITRPNIELVSIEPLGTNIIESWIQKQAFLFNNMNLQTLSNVYVYIYIIASYHGGIIVIGIIGSLAF